MPTPVPSNPKRTRIQALAGEEGITGLETAIILIAFIIVASSFAFMVLTTGMFAAERGKQTVLAGLERVSGNLEVRGSLILQDVGSDGLIDSTDPDVFILTVSTAAGGRPVLVDPAATVNTLVINLVDGGGRAAGLSYTVLKTLGDADDLLETGELFEITIAMPAGISLDANEEFSLELIPQSGGTLILNRLMPPQVTDVIDFH
ncbi:MAG: archaellin/type IV pilin N-terminal domain-containing protein [Dehalococcoidia bacterium]